MGAQAVRLSNVDIDNALKNKDFEILFQPIFDLGNGALARVESFVRWRHPSLGVLPPGAFISFFETQGRMSELTRYVLSQSLSDYLNWRGAFAPGFSINLAMSDLADEAFPSHFLRVLRDARFPPELVTLECPMPTVGADVDIATRQFARLGETGARLAIEVRGRANDFLRTVKPFPFAEIKTGGAAILRFARTVRGPGLSAISELLELAADQQAAITAVGVEDQQSLAALRGLGFAAAQGNHLGKVGALNQFAPSRVNEVRELLGLEPLSREDLAALFRAGAPALPHAPEPDAEMAPSGLESVAEGEDALVERLAARIRRGEEIADEAAQTAEERKAAAIARARRKTLLRARAQRMAQANAAEDTHAAAPRDMQDRLTREFEAFTDGFEEPAHETPAEAEEERIDLDAEELAADTSFPSPDLGHDAPATAEAEPATTDVAPEEAVAADEIADYDAVAQNADAADAAIYDAGMNTAASDDDAPAAKVDDAHGARALRDGPAVSGPALSGDTRPETDHAPRPARAAFGQRRLSFDANAYAVPVVHVQGADYSPPPRAARPAPAPAPDPTLDIPVPPLPPAKPEPAPTIADPAIASDAVGTLDRDDAEALVDYAAAAFDERQIAERHGKGKARARPKNLLTRKYALPRITHFWPRSFRKLASRARKPAPMA